MSIEFYYLALGRDAEKEFPFVIHGLWPQYSPGHWPTFCREQPFVFSRLKSLLPQLRAEWHNYRGPDEKFWEHEWLKHGTCTGMSEIEYFTKVLELSYKTRDLDPQWIWKQFSGRTFNLPIDLDWNFVVSENATHIQLIK